MSTAREALDRFEEPQEVRFMATLQGVTLDLDGDYATLLLRVRDSVTLRGPGVYVREFSGQTVDVPLDQLTAILGSTPTDEGAPDG